MWATPKLLTIRAPGNELERASWSLSTVAAKGSQEQAWNRNRNQDKARWVAQKEDHDSRSTWAKSLKDPISTNDWTHSGVCLSSQLHREAQIGGLWSRMILA
jgi:hypothetical protein